MIPGVYLSCVDLGVYSDMMCIPYMPDVIRNDLTEFSFLNERFLVDQENNVVIRERTGEQRQIVEFTSGVLRFTPFKL